MLSIYLSQTLVPHSPSWRSGETLAMETDGAGSSPWLEFEFASIEGPRARARGSRVVARRFTCGLMLRFPTAESWQHRVLHGVRSGAVGWGPMNVVDEHCFASWRSERCEVSEDYYFTAGTADRCGRCYYC